MRWLVRTLERLASSQLAVAATDSLNFRSFGPPASKNSVASMGLSKNMLRGLWLGTMMLRCLGAKGCETSFSLAQRVQAPDTGLTTLSRRDTRILFLMHGNSAQSAWHPHA